MQHRPVSLKRTLSLPVVTFYGLGTIVGAGVYVLIGKVAGLAGDKLVYAFLLAGLIAAFTALSYSELASRFPKSAGEALYVEKAFGSVHLARTVGWLVVLTGIVSAATIANGFTGYLAVFVSVPAPAAITVLVLVLGAIAAWGIKQSALLITLITAAEIGGLVYVAYAGLAVPEPQNISTALALPAGTEIIGVLLGAFLAFYAFIGFEDMVNLVEEVKNPRRMLPLAILAAISIAIILYVLVALVALYAVPASVLAASDAPLAAIVKAGGFSPGLIALISLVAVINGALVQIIMASRVIYGMARQGIAHAWLGRVMQVTQTPVIATSLTVAAVLGFALWLPLTTLAQLTSFIVLAVFTLVNAGLVVIKWRDRKPGSEPANSAQVSADVFTVSAIIPLVGTALCGALFFFQLLA